MPERPHSRKKTVAEGTAEVKKGGQIQNAIQAGDGLSFSQAGTMSRGAGTMSRGADAKSRGADAGSQGPANKEFQKTEEAKKE